MPPNKPRRDASRRQLEQEPAERAAREAARKRVTLIASIVGTLVLIAAVVIVIAVATGGKSGGDKTTAAGGTTAPTGAAANPASAPATDVSPGGTRAPGSCTFTPDGNASRQVKLPAATAPTAGTATIDVSTNQGPLTFTLDRKAAPCTVASFVSLVDQKYFDDTPCHRLTTSGIYVLQCGDPTGTGTGGPGYTIPDEVSGNEQYRTGVLAMANTGQPNSGGSQFFIVYKDTQLPPSYTVFGTVTTGMSVVDAVAAKGAAGGGGDGKPNLPVQITSMKVVK